MSTAEGVRIEHGRTTPRIKCRSISLSLSILTNSSLVGGFETERKSRRAGTRAHESEQREGEREEQRRYLERPGYSRFDLVDRVVSISHQFNRSHPSSSIDISSLQLLPSIKQYRYLITSIAPIHQVVSISHHFNRSHQVVSISHHFNRSHPSSSIDISSSSRHVAHSAMLNQE